MTYTLFDLTLYVARELGVLTYSDASAGGASTTLIDTKRTEADDYWNGGSMWLTYNADSPGTAPQGHYKRITDFVQSTGTFTIAPDWSANVGAGDNYAVCRKFGNQPMHEILRRTVNDAIRNLGPVAQTDTSLTIAAGQTEYTLPVAAAQDLRQVWLQNDTDSDDNQWEEVLGWRKQEHSTAGSADTLLLPAQYATGYKLKLVYVAPHTELLAHTDKMTDHIPVELVVPPAVLGTLQFMKQATGWNRWDAQITHWTGEAQRARGKFRKGNPRRTPRLISPNDAWKYSDYPGDRTPR